MLRVSGFLVICGLFRRKLMSGLSTCRAFTVVLIVCGLLSPLMPCQTVEITENDWPMLAHDVGRSGSTPGQIDGPVQRAWVRYFHMEGLMPSVGPVVVDGTLYVGTLTGVVHAIDTETGEDIWQSELGGPITHTACVSADGLVVVGAADGKVYALDADDGEQIWTYTTGAPLWNSPLPWKGRIYIGGRDGVFYCLDGKTGLPVWKFGAGAPIFQSPALDEQAGRVVFTAEDRVVYALDAASGGLAWSSPELPGTTARSFYPVIAPDGTVMTVAIPYYSWHHSHRLLDKVLEEIFGTEKLKGEDVKTEGEFVRLKSWRHNEQTNERFDKHTREIFLKPTYFARLVKALRKAVDADPDARCLHLLDGSTGKLKKQVPVLYTAFAKSQFTPPVVTPQGKVITKWWAFLPSTYSAYQRQVNLAYIDTGKGQLSPVFNESRVNSGLGLSLIADESCQLSVAGSKILNIANHYGEKLCFFDLADPELDSSGQLYKTHTHWWGVGVIHRILRDQTDRIAPGQEDLTKGFGVGNPGELATGNHTAANMPAVVANGMLFYTSADKLMALAPAEKAPTFNRSEELADYGIEPLTDQELHELYTTWPVNWDDVDVKPESGEWGNHKIHTPARVKYLPGTKQNPDKAAGNAADEVSDSVLDDIIRSVDPPEPSDSDKAAEIRKKLIFAVEEFISQPAWMPYRFMGGKHPSDYIDFFTDPAEPTEALAWAYPHLPESLQKRVLDYVSGKLGSEKSPLFQDRLPSGRGEPREPYRVPDIDGRTFTYERNPGFGRLYVAWLWGNRTGQWEPIRDAWPNLRPENRQDLQPGKTEWYIAKDHDIGNNLCASLIAACRLARRFEDTETLELVLPAARRALRERLRHELVYHRGNVASKQVGLWRGFVRWQYLTPEVGRLLAEQAPDVAPNIVKTYLDRLRPYWHLAWGPLSPSGKENSVQLPHNTLAAFKAKAFIGGETPEKLANYCDIPHCKADPYYIQKLSITLDAYAEAAKDKK